MLKYQLLNKKPLYLLAIANQMFHVEQWQLLVVGFCLFEITFSLKMFHVEHFQITQRKLPTGKFAFIYK